MILTLQPGIPYLHPPPAPFFSIALITICYSRYFVFPAPKNVISTSGEVWAILISSVSPIYYMLGAEQAFNTRLLNEWRNKINFLECKPFPENLGRLWFILLHDVAWHHGTDSRRCRRLWPGALQLREFRAAWGPASGHPCSTAEQGQVWPSTWCCLHVCLCYLAERTLRTELWTPST